MNIFNSFQAVGFYTALPLGIEWTFANGYNVWGYVLSGVLCLGFGALSVAVSEFVK